MIPANSQLPVWEAGTVVVGHAVQREDGGTPEILGRGQVSLRNGAEIHGDGTLFVNAGSRLGGNGRIVFADVFVDGATLAISGIRARRRGSSLLPTRIEMITRMENA